MAVHWCLPDRRLDRAIFWYAVGDQDLGGFWGYEVDVALFNLDGAPFSIDGEERPEPWLFATNFARAHWIEKGAGTMVMVKFARGALYRLFGIDGDASYGRVHGADAARYPGLAAVDATLRAAGPALAARIAALDAALLPYARVAAAEGPAEAFRYLAQRRHGAVRVAEAARALGVTPRTLERHCRQRFGRTPAQLIRAVRYTAALVPQMDGRTPGWRGVPADVPYADQSHFLRDARQLVGKPPSVWPGTPKPAPDAYLYPRGAIGPVEAIDAARAEADWAEARALFRFGG